MTALFESPGFWPLVTSMLLGLGWWVRRLVARKDENARKLDEQMVRNREQAQVLSDKYTQRTEELMECRADRRYLEKLLEKSEREVDRLKGKKE